MAACCSIMARSVFKGKCHSVLQDTCIHTIDSLKLYLDVQAIKSFMYLVTFQAEFRLDIPIAACCWVGNSRKSRISTSLGFSSCFLYFKEDEPWNHSPDILEEGNEKVAWVPGRDWARVCCCQKGVSNGDRDKQRRQTCSLELCLPKWSESCRLKKYLTDNKENSGGGGVGV